MVEFGFPLARLRSGHQLQFDPHTLGKCCHEEVCGMCSEEFFLARGVVCTWTESHDTLHERNRWIVDDPSCEKIRLTTALSTGSSSGILQAYTNVPRLFPLGNLIGSGRDRDDNLFLCSSLMLISNTVVSRKFAHPFCIKL